MPTGPTTSSTVTPPDGSPTGGTTSPTPGTTGTPVAPTGSNSTTGPTGGTGTPSVTPSGTTTTTGPGTGTTTEGTSSTTGTDGTPPVPPTGYVTTDPGDGRFPLVASGAVPIVTSSQDFAGVTRVAGDLKNDIKLVTGAESTVVADTVPSGAQQVVLLGTLGKAPLIDALVTAGKLDVSAIEGKWETSLAQVVDAPMDGVASALVLTGSDQRGAIYAAYDLSKQMGVSPWYFFDDVMPVKKTALYVLPGPHSDGEPAVKYRGFFVNDEEPNLGGWVKNTFGAGVVANQPQGFNSKFYSKLFELMLRLKANYLWPAVWGRAFAEDDPQNHATAKAYGVVMGTSHEAPMMRGIEEWNRHATDTSDPYGGNGKWSYVNNTTAIEAYWQDGIQRMVDEDFEAIVTLGMRGNGDTSLSDGDGIELMQSIVESERNILSTLTGKPIESIPQVWTLYKEVQNYWDSGLRAPDDVTIVWCDDNWGNMRELPDQKAASRAGGYGLYYHFDYVGGGRNYKWVDTNLIPNVWEQLNLAYTYGVERLWMVNAGDVKNAEAPLTFFLDYAWNPSRWTADKLDDWELQYATLNFGPDHAADIASVIHEYAHLQARRKPELTNRLITLDPSQNITTTDSAIIYSDASPFSLTNYRELETMVGEWDALAAKAKAINAALPKEQQDAFYQLALYAIEATDYLYSHRLTAFRNILYKAQGRASTNDVGALAQSFFDQGTAAATYYNTTLAGGKWKGFQNQPYVGYGDVARYGDNASWQQPEQNNQALPDAPYPHLVALTPASGASMGVAIDGSDKVWPDESSMAKLPKFSRYQTQPKQYVEVFSRGTQSFDYTITVPATASDWLTVTPASGTIDDAHKDVRAELIVDWTKAPTASTDVAITVSGANGTVTVNATVDGSTVPAGFKGFVEANGVVSIESDHFTRKVDAGDIFWQRIADIGRTGSGMTPFPPTAAKQTPGGAAPHLEFDVNLFTTGNVRVWAYVSPRNDVLRTGGLKYAVSFDDGTPVTVNITTALNGIPMNRSWERNTSDNINLTSSQHSVGAAGAHTLKFWMVDPTVILQKIVIDAGGMQQSYLGPPESYIAQ